LEPHEIASAAISAAARGVITGTLASRGLAVVASTSCRSSVAAGMSTKVCASSSRGAAPHARACASSVSQGCVSGATSRRSDRPKLSMARATAPMFPGANGLASSMTGWVALVASAASIAAILVGGGASRLVFITMLLCIERHERRAGKCMGIPRLQAATRRRMLSSRSSGAGGTRSSGDAGDATRPGGRTGRKSRNALRHSLTEHWGKSCTCT
jgi:hypothetical protein